MGDRQTIETIETVATPSRPSPSSACPWTVRIYRGRQALRVLLRDHAEQLGMVA